MNRNGNNRRGIGTDVLEDVHPDVQSETAFYDPSNPVLAPVTTTTFPIFVATPNS